MSDRSAWESRPTIGGKESRALARSIADAFPDDEGFMWYFNRFTDPEWRMHTQWTEDDENGDPIYAPVWVRIIEWHFVPDGYSPSKAAMACIGSGGATAGPNSRGTWYTRTEHTWTDPTTTEAVDPQMALFA
jgi:hypothetical protein